MSVCVWEGLPGDWRLEEGRCLGCVATRARTCWLWVATAGPGRGWSARFRWGDIQGGLVEWEGYCRWAVWACLGCVIVWLLWHC